MVRFQLGRIQMRQANGAHPTLCISNAPSQWVTAISVHPMGRIKGGVSESAQPMGRSQYSVITYAMHVYISMHDISSHSSNCSVPAILSCSLIIKILYVSVISQIE